MRIMHEKEASWTLEHGMVKCSAQGLGISGGKDCEGVKAPSKKNVKKPRRQD